MRSFVGALAMVSHQAGRPAFKLPKPYLDPLDTREGTEFMGDHLMLASSILARHILQRAIRYIDFSKSDATRAGIADRAGSDLKHRAEREICTHRSNSKEGHLHYLNHSYSVDKAPF